MWDEYNEMVSPEKAVEPPDGEAARPPAREGLVVHAEDEARPASPVEEAEMSEAPEEPAEPEFVDRHLGGCWRVGDAEL